MSARKQFSTFWVEHLFFGVEVDRVQEVIRYQQITRVPLAPAVVSGLINLRGHIVTALDLRKRLDLNPRPADQQPMNVVIRTDGEAVSLLVDEIGDVLDVSDDAFETPPESLQGKTKDLISGVYKLDGVILHVLDTNKAASNVEISRVL
jgi:purine-binding chemotaxis protein CheW